MAYKRVYSIRKSTQKQHFEVDFKETSRLSILNSEEIKTNLMVLVSQPYTCVNLNMSGINFIDSKAFDDLNSLSEIAEINSSEIMLSNVDSSVMELIELVTKYNRFNIKISEPKVKRAKVA